MIDDIDLPFAFGWPRPPRVQNLGETTSVIYRQVLALDRAGTPTLHARLAVHPTSAARPPDLRTTEQPETDRPAARSQRVPVFFVGKAIVGGNL